MRHFHQARVCRWRLQIAAVVMATFTAQAAVPAGVMWAAAADAHSSPTLIICPGGQHMAAHGLHHSGKAGHPDGCKRCLCLQAGLFLPEAGLAKWGNAVLAADFHTTLAPARFAVPFGPPRQQTPRAPPASG